jgi:hypothetical protein
MLVEQTEAQRHILKILFVSVIKKLIKLLFLTQKQILTPLPHHILSPFHKDT